MVATSHFRVNSQYTGSPQDACIQRDEANALALLPLFAPIASLLQAFAAHAGNDLDALNALARDVVPQPRTSTDQRIHFVHPLTGQPAYETKIEASGAVPTRSGNWHDVFNALVWMRFPQTKAQLNTLHVEERRQREPRFGRGPVRDAATQFDESGIIVLSSNRGLFALLAERRWSELFWLRRDDVVRSMRFIVFGHGLYDALRAPFYRMCGRAAFVPAHAGLIDAPVIDQCRHADELLAQRFALRTYYPRPRALMALPILGIPGVCADNENAEYYADAVQFRPPPQAHDAA